MSGPPVLSQTSQAGLLAQRRWLDHEQRLTAFLADLNNLSSRKKETQDHPKGNWEGKRVSLPDTHFFLVTPRLTCRKFLTLLSSSLMLPRGTILVPM